MPAVQDRTTSAARVHRVGVKGAHFSSFTSARTHLKDLLDAAEEGLPASVVRDGARSVLVDAARLAAVLRRSRPADAQVVNENGYWAAMLPGTSLAGEGETFDEAISDLVLALRDYAEDWSERLRHAPNHADQWPLVQLVELSDDEQLRDWLLAGS
ncbi:prevent-host-death protein [Ornithinimicrobium cerasi]|uniref:Antitoxin of toxin-antitoxin, RelE / RelB, TA system n=1 Tax=Ornithinimicrobium cerasi TaxID=2248773 RepID=A0A285VHY9_9MICO|nr:prevent-host-death protein [Ornithinimicrobium cerasi]SOC53724.1 Antitoxin of toxin-antitoxin, RelE / RelB, TA system [Ornithinimicrobium cerasi]